eukprot:285313-Amphidinium_carterae.1
MPILVSFIGPSLREGLATRRAVRCSGAWRGIAKSIGDMSAALSEPREASGAAIPGAPALTSAASALPAGLAGLAQRGSARIGSSGTGQAFCCGRRASSKSQSAQFAHCTTSNLAYKCRSAKATMRIYACFL